MNATLVQRALEVVPDRHVLINLISGRVRQLRSGNGSERHSLVAESSNRSLADTALLELIEGRMTFEMPEWIPVKRPNQQGKRPKGWARTENGDASAPDRWKPQPPVAAPAQ